MKPIVFPWLIASEDSMNSFGGHAGQITHISPTWYTMTADLSVEAKEQPEVRDIARKAGCKLVPLIVNEKFRVDVAHAILSTAESRARAADKIASLIVDNGFDGINMDFEGPFVEDRDNYSKFLAEIRRRLPSGKELSVDIVPQTKPPEMTSVPSREKELDKWILAWREVFDYPTIAESVDQFILMGYDYSGRLSPPGPVSPLWWLREIVEYALRYVPKEKVVLGLPFYGRQWTVQPDGKYSEGRAIDAAQGRKLAEQRSVPVETDEKTITRRVRWTENGAYGEAYFDDAETLKVKMALVTEYDLAGVAFWRLGTEDPEIWEAIRSRTP